MEIVRNENGKIDLYLGRDMGGNMLKVGEFNSLSELRKEGLKLLKDGAKCENDLPAREYAYKTVSGMRFGWNNIKFKRL